MNQLQIFLTPYQIRIVDPEGQIIESKETLVPFTTPALFEAIRDLLKKVTMSESVQLCWIVDAPWIRFLKLPIPTSSKIKARRILDFEVTNWLIDEDKEFNFDFQIHTEDEKYVALVYLCENSYLDQLNEITSEFSNEMARVEPLFDYLDQVCRREVIDDNSFFMIPSDDIVRLVYYENGLLSGVRQIALGEGSEVAYQKKIEDTVNLMVLSENLKPVVELDREAELYKCTSKVNLSSQSGVLLELILKYIQDFKLTAVFVGTFIFLLMVSFAFNQFDAYKQLNVEKKLLVNLARKARVSEQEPDRILLIQEKKLKEWKKKWKGYQDYSYRDFKQLSLLKMFSEMKETSSGLKIISFQAHETIISLRGEVSNQAELDRLKRKIDKQFVVDYTIKFSSKSIEGGGVKFSLSLRSRKPGGT